MSKCKHENADHLMPGDYYSNGRPHQTIVVAVEQFRCADCGHWLSLGPSNDEPEEVRVEMRASELAGDPSALTFTRQFIGTEWDGWRREEAIDLTVVSRDGSRREERLVPLNLDSPKWRAGYLAREIVTLDDSHSASTAGGGE